GVGGGGAATRKRAPGTTAQGPAPGGGGSWAGRGRPSGRASRASATPPSVPPTGGWLTRPPIAWPSGISTTRRSPTRSATRRPLRSSRRACLHWRRGHRRPTARAYRGAAEATAAALVTRHLRPDGMLTDGCYSPRIGLATRHELVWGSYYLFEALHTLAGLCDPTKIA